MANLDLLEREGLVEQVRALEPRLAAAVGSLAGAPLVGEVRSVGLMAAVELERSVLAADPGAIERVVAAMRKRGVLSRSIGGRAVQISPAFVVEPSDLDRIVETIGAALEEVSGTIG
jgi:adenosylmethionine-8-amino-7-oxononanoate aminotransferase